MSTKTEKASRLFQYLADAASRKSTPVQQMSEYRKADGAIRNLEELRQELQNNGLTEDADADELDLILRVHRPEPPVEVAAKSELEEFLAGPLNNPNRRPEIMKSLVEKEANPADLEEELEDYLHSWDEWALSAKAFEQYQELFDMQTKANQQADDFELVLGVGRLKWDLEDPGKIDRHLFVVGLEINMNKHTGSIELRLGDQPLRAELEMIPGEVLEDQRFVEELREYLNEHEVNPLEVKEFDELGRYTSNGLSTASKYIASATPTTDAGNPILTWEPTLILRPRRQAGLAETFRAIAELIETDGTVPPGLLPLVDPYFEGRVETDPSPGALANIDGEIFSPLPLNKEQLNVLHRVDTHAQTVVLGPPGTGKTHMAAALLSHLLAQGKRVLVTAAKERALYELREKLPEEIRELAVSVIGNSQNEMAELRTAIETINRKSSTFDDIQAWTEIGELEHRLDELRERRAYYLAKWVKELEQEQTPLGIEGYEHSASKVIQRVNDEQDQYGWIENLTLTSAEDPFPLDKETTQQVCTLLLDEDVITQLNSRFGSAYDPSQLPSPATFAEALAVLQQAEARAEKAKQSIEAREATAWLKLPPNEQRSTLKALEQLALADQTVRASTLEWEGKLQPGAPMHALQEAQNRVEQHQSTLDSVASHIETIRAVRRVTVDGDVDAYVPMAKSMAAYLNAGKTLKVQADGSVKPPLFGGGEVKQCLPFFQSVHIDSMPPTTLEAIEQYLAYVEVRWALQGVGIADHFDDPIRTYEQANGTLQHIADYNAQLMCMHTAMTQLSELQLSLNDAISLSHIVPALTEYCDAHEELAVAQREYKRISTFHDDAYSGPLQPWMQALNAAGVSRNLEGYADALEHGRSYFSTALKTQELIGHLHAIGQWSKELERALRAPTSLEQWRIRLPEMEEARLWLLAKRYIAQLVPHGEDKNLAQITITDTKIQEAISALAAKRAWAEALGDTRIDGYIRRRMQSYVEAVKRLGKGGGTYASLHRRDIRRHLDASRAAVPVWIMPIHKVIEQFSLEQNMFDVVIIDEASQANLDAIFLQFLAPRIVVIGDDKQVSPSSGGIHVGRLKKAAKQYLYDFEDFDAWTSPGRSLFDDAKMRYGNTIALIEHRRCVPEIIEFSNKLTYRKDKVELRPVREVPADRLPPFRITRTPNAFLDEGSGKVNRAEALMLVQRLKEALNDDAYAGKTIGIISLLSSSKQADFIRNRILETFPSEIWEERDLKVGKPEEFQGAERDVIFLSMVEPSQRENRATLNRETNIQRYNVAVSRAKDQVWLFHSVGIDDLTNPEDVRRQLLEHAYSVAESQPELRESHLVSYDTPTEPFDSLFEQRVYNELVQRGYYVIPQFETAGRRIDLVVQGSHARLAVECDGDHWHNEEHAIADQSRQRELERLGWKFVRIYESDFYIDKEEQIQKVIDQLDSFGITPGYSALPSEESNNVEVIEEVFGRLPEEPTPAKAASQEEEEDVEKPKPPQPVTIDAYSECTIPTVEVDHATRNQIDEGLRDIIAIEGPIRQDLLFSRYVKSSGCSQRTTVARSVLTAGVKRLEKHKVIEHEMDGGPVYRLADTPPVRPRTRGSRLLDEVPSNEIIAHIEIAMRQGATAEEDIIQQVKHQMEIKRLSGKTRSRITRFVRKVLREQ
ncbi:AAA family ATPase [Corynebacterium sp. CCUG 18816]|uniref:AAA domain-containing protein n=1 Tax=Corynebacterium pseudogenitalium TaxID=38303 RepID=UPI00210B0097|nr:AAA domain-containing protein [Corynebacterium pseudogenitalium]MCQ4616904.1 AAA family ATPase [Corynebacterium pseudogenitalium]